MYLLDRFYFHRWLIQLSVYILMYVSENSKGDYSSICYYLDKCPLSLPDMCVCLSRAALAIVGHTPGMGHLVALSSQITGDGPVSQIRCSMTSYATCHSTPTHRQLWFLHQSIQFSPDDLYGISPRLYFHCMRGWTMKIKNDSYLFYFHYYF